MTDLRTWHALQNRWAAGESLSPDEERLRLEYAQTDALAERELALFSELRGRIAEPDASSPNRAATLAAARGVRLRVVAPDERPRAATAAHSFGRRRGVWLAAAASLLLGSGAAAWLLAPALRERPAAKLSSSVANPQQHVELPPAPAAARAELVFTSGEVLVDDHATRVGAGTLASGQRVATRDGRACVGIDPGIDVCLGAHSAIRVESLAGSALRLRVTQGTAIAALTPRSQGHTFSLVANDVQATAHGTVFAVDSSEARATRVTVLEGVVGVSRPGTETERVGALSELTLKDGNGRASQLIGRGEEGRLRALLGPREIWQPADLGVLEIHEAPLGARISIDDRGPFAAPLGLFVGSGRHRVAWRSADGTAGSLETEVAAGAVQRLPLLTSAQAREDSAPSAATLLEQARERLAAGDARSALLLYRRLRATRPASPEAVTVLVPLGRLELELGAPDRALAAFETYGKGGGPLAPEALSGKIRALRALGRTSDERSSIEEALRRFPNGFESAALRKRLAALAAP